MAFLPAAQPGLPQKKDGEAIHEPDLQRVDMGIAMCHFELTARELELSGHWGLEPSQVGELDEGLEYTITWVE